VPVLYFLVARRGRAAELQREGAIAMGAAEQREASPHLEVGRAA